MIPPSTMLLKTLQRQMLKPCTFDEQRSGPYRVLQTHINGTVTIELRPGVSEKLNIRRIIPYKE